VAFVAEYKAKGWELSLFSGQTYEATNYTGVLGIRPPRPTSHVATRLIRPLALVSLPDSFAVALNAAAVLV